MPNDDDLTLAELASLADVPPRTIRYYVAQGILPGPVAAGPASRYPASALARLRLVRQLQRGHLPLAEIRRRLSELTDDEVLELAALPVPPPHGSALDYVRSVLDQGTASAPSMSSRPAGREDDAPPQAAFEPPQGAFAPTLARRTMPDAGMPSAWDTVSVPAGTRAPAVGADASPTEPAEALTPASPRAADRRHGVRSPERSQWDRIVLEPDVELHVRRPLSRIANKRVDRLLAFARQLLEEDQP